MKCRGGNGRLYPPLPRARVGGVNPRGQHLLLDALTQNKPLEARFSHESATDPE